MSNIEDFENEGGPTLVEPSPQESSEEITLEEPEVQKKKFSKKTTAGVIGLSIVALTAAIALGAPMVMRLFNSDGPSAFVESKGVMVYTQSNLDPSLDQKLQLMGFVSKLPRSNTSDFKEKFDKDNIYPSLMKNFNVSGNEYKWIKDKISLTVYSAMNDEDGQPVFSMIFESADNVLAEKELNTLISSESFTSDSQAFSVVKLSNSYIGITNASDPETVFDTKDTLAADENYSSTAKSSESNLVSYWLNFEEFSNYAENTVGEESSSWQGLGAVKYSGFSYGSLVAQNDNLSMTAFTRDLKINGKTPEVFGDSQKNAELTNGVAYNNAVGTLGIAGLGETIKSNFETFDPSGELSRTFEETYGLKPADLKKLLGDNISISWKDEPSGKINLAAKIVGVDSDFVNKKLEETGFTMDTLNGQLAGYAPGTRITNENGVIEVIPGNPPEGKGTFTPGKMLLNFKISPLLGYTGSASEEEGANENWGEVSLQSDNVGGENQAVLKWKI